MHLLFTQVHFLFWQFGQGQYVTASLIQFALLLVKLPDFAIGKSPPQHNRFSSMLYGWCDTGGCSSFATSSLLINLPIWLKDFELWFVSPKNFIPLLYCPVFVHLGSLEPIDIVLLPQRWFLDRNFAIKTSFTKCSLHSGCWYIFSRHWFRCAVEKSAFSHASWWNWRNCPLHK